MPPPTQRRNGASLYIQKPTSFNGLIEILKKCLLEKVGTAAPKELEQFFIMS